MSLEPVGYIDLPPHEREGGFDHAAVHNPSGRLYVAHTANDAVDVVDTRENRYVRSISGLREVAGALVSDERGLVFTSNRGEDTVAVFPEGDTATPTKIKVGVRPNGLAFDPKRNMLLAANVGDPAKPETHTVTLVDVARGVIFANPRVPGRTRWAIFDAATDRFFVNVREPPTIVVLEAGEPTGIAATFPVPAAGPHGLDLERAQRRLFCACDDRTLLVLSLPDGRIIHRRALTGPPDVVTFNPAKRRLYVAIGDPGVIDVFDTGTMERLESRATEKGAHTIACDPQTGRIFAFLPATHRAVVFADEG